MPPARRIPVPPARRIPAPPARRIPAPPARRIPAPTERRVPAPLPRCRHALRADRPRASPPRRPDATSTRRGCATPARRFHAPQCRPRHRAIWLNGFDVSRAICRRAPPAGRRPAPTLHPQWSEATRVRAASVARFCGSTTARSSVSPAKPAFPHRRRPVISRYVQPACPAGRYVARAGRRPLRFLRSTRGPLIDPRQSEIPQRRGWRRRRIIKFHPGDRCLDPATDDLAPIKFRLPPPRRNRLEARSLDAGRHGHEHRPMRLPTPDVATTKQPNHQVRLDVVLRQSRILAIDDAPEQAYRLSPETGLLDYQVTHVRSLRAPGGIVPQDAQDFAVTASKSPATRRCRTSHLRLDDPGSRRHIDAE